MTQRIISDGGGDTRAACTDNFCKTIEEKEGKQRSIKQTCVFHSLTLELSCIAHSIVILGIIR